MARRQDTRTGGTKSSGPKLTAKPPAKSAKRSGDASKVAKAKRGPAGGKTAAQEGAKGASATRSARAKSSSASLEAVRTPVTAVTPVSPDTRSQVKSETKKALKAAKKSAKAVKKAGKKGSKEGGIHLPELPTQVADSLKAIGMQVAGALNTDVGRAMVAELLVFVATSLTKTAAKTEPVEDMKATLLNAGAKIAAATADAGASAMRTGRASSASGADPARGGKGATDDAAGVVRGLTQAAVGAATEVVAETAQKVLRRRRTGKAMAATAAETPSEPTGSGQEDGLAPPIDAEAGDQPRQL